MSAATTMMPPTRAAAQTETVLHSFDVNGSNPNSPLIFDGSGNLYGTTQYGGDGFGTAFELSPQSGGSWKATLLHSFGLNPSDGQNPSGGLVRDAAGNLYGTTINGGADTCSSTAPKGCGTVFELSPKAGGGWSEKVLHRFSNDGEDGFYPEAGLAVDASGKLYGTTEFGGSSTNCSTFHLTVAARCSSCRPRQAEAGPRR